MTASRRLDRARTAVLVVVAGVLLAVAGFLAFGTSERRVSAEGEVVTADRNRPCQIVFTDADGVERRHAEATSSTRRRTIGCRLRVGEEVTVFYPPGRPQDADLDGTSEQRVGAGVSAVLGLLFAALAVNQVRVGRRRTPPAS